MVIRDRIERSLQSNFDDSWLSSGTSKQIGCCGIFERYGDQIVDGDIDGDWPDPIPGDNKTVLVIETGKVQNDQSYLIKPLMS
mmetsp:Transcript_13279/g.29260  ORF Transcript_13279/g.29260 Transcript_13279/m.29260 type:complete len:83 (+) Transcript_13279:174-422(+)